MLPESATSRVYTDFAGLAKLKASARNESPEAIKAVTKEFESSFVEMMMKSLRDASSEEGLMDNDASRMYQDMFDKQIAVEISERGDFGIAKVIEAQLSRKNSKQMPTVEKNVQGFGPAAQNPFNHTGLMNRAAQTIDRTVPQQRQSVPVKPLIDMRPTGSMIYEHAAKKPVVKRAEQPEKTTFDSPAEFIRAMRPHAERAARELGVNPDILVAQAALETGWGKKVIRNPDGSNSHNLFGIKASRGWEGETVKVGSLEYRAGIARREVSSFRSYPSYTESFRDYVDFIKSHPRYNNALNNAGNHKAYIKALQQAGYATDPNYANKIINILERKNLQSAWKGSA